MRSTSCIRDVPFDPSSKSTSKSSQLESWLCFIFLEDLQDPSERPCICKTFSA
jgi:hypothetical protein